MEKNKLSDLDIKTDHIKGTKYNELIIDYPDGYSGIKYRFEGIFSYVMLDFYNVLIYEYDDPLNKTSPRITIFSRLDDGHVINHFPMLGEFPKVSEGLRKIKKLIIPYYGRYFLYSYEYGGVVSGFFNKMIFDEDSQTFYVEYYKATIYGDVTLFGSLDFEGHLIDDALFIPELGIELLVDEHNLDSSIDSYLPKIERSIKKKENNEKQREYNEFEYQLYLKRKRKNS